jgi:hypothetical protein
MITYSSYLATVGETVFPTLLERGRVGTVSYVASTMPQIDMSSLSEHSPRYLDLHLLRSDRTWPGNMQQAGILRCLSLGPPIHSHR